MASIVFDNEVLNCQDEEIIGQNEFGFWQIITGIFVDLSELSKEVNDAVDEVYGKGF